VSELARGRKAGHGQEPHAPEPRRAELVSAASSPTPVDPSETASCLPIDGRQSPAARDIARGTARLLALMGCRAIPEVVLANGRRADLLALGEKGEIAIVEVKSSLADFRADAKWPEYREFSDRLYFAVAPDFPREVLPEEVGIIVADRYGAEVVRDAPEHTLAGARRKALLLRFARVAAGRLMTLADPEQALEPLPRE
jgi:hypothetical protein